MFSLEFSVKDAESIFTAGIIDLHYTKERYTPYTMVSGRAMVPLPPENMIKAVSLFDDNTLMHYGLPDEAQWTYKNGCGILSFSSKGFSAALGQNQLTPGMYPNTTFEELMTGSIALPHVEYEQMDKPINYVYIKENDTMWSAAAAFARKYCGEYPYISKNNTVRITKDETLPVLDVPGEDIVSVSRGVELAHIISHYHMRDVEGTYNTYNLTNQNAVDLDIIRHKHIVFDRQWLSDPDEAMQSRADYAARGMEYINVCYNGYGGEDVRQEVNFSAQGIKAKGREISRIDLTVNRKGTLTTLWCYGDSYTKAL